MLGCYTFSTYTVVKNGREVFSATSEYFFMKTTCANIKRVDRAKNCICKWIDNECDIYRHINNGEEAELTESHNDIYDFILHVCDDDTRARIHRGDFRISSHTSINDNYRKFGKSYQICDTVELRVSTENSDLNTTEVIFINMKHPIHFYVEKNIILDKKFLRWYLYSKLGRKDLAEYIGLPYSKYEVNIYYENFMKDVCVGVKSSCLLAALTDELVTPETGVEQRIRAFRLDDSQYILVGNQYMVKVDSVLGCPVFESIDKDVYHIDDALTNYYENSVCSDTDDGYVSEDEHEDPDDEDEDQDQDQDQDDESAVTDYTDNDEPEPEPEPVVPVVPVVAVESINTSLPDSEFEIIEPSFEHSND